MKLVDNILYIEFADFIAAGWKEAAVFNANLRNGQYWQMIKDPSDKRKPLVQYDTLRKNHQEKLVAQFGNPYEYISKEPIKKLIIPDIKAELFFKDYRYDDNKVLPFEHQCRYTKAASWLNMLVQTQVEKQFIKKTLNLSLDKFWASVTAIIKSEGIELPGTYQKLLVKIKTYKEQGYACLIDWRFGNKNTAKIGKGEDGFDADIYEKQVAIIRRCASMHQNFDAAQITSFVNPIFKKQEWPTVSSSTIYNICKENSHLTLAGRRGRKEFNSTLTMQHLRKRPEFPLYYLTLDGWTVELLYQENNEYNKRLVVVIVLDTFNNYPIGYAIGERENVELIKEANRNAAYHIQELFGDHYQPRQIQSDNYGVKQLTPFYQAMGHLHTPAAVGNAKAKVIEPYFNYINKKYCQRFPNWSGHNITASKKNQPNTEFLDKIKTSFPDKAGVIQQIELMIALERKAKVEQYITKWNEMPAEERLIMSKENRLLVYGSCTNYTNSITGMGLTVSINGEKHIYDSFDASFRNLQHMKFTVMYDQADLSKVLAITEDGKRRFVLDAKRALPMDVHSMTADDHAYRQQITGYNKDKVQEVMDTYEKDAAVVNEVISNTPFNLENHEEATLKLMFTYNGQQKDKLQDAKRLGKATKKTEEPTNTNWLTFLETNNDFSEFEQ